MYLIPLLQSTEGVDITPEQLDQTVNQLSESTIALAEAAANFGALKVIFAAFIIFTFILLVLFLYQIIATTRKVEKIHESTQKLEKSLEDTESRTLGKSQANLLIRRVFSSLKQNVKYTILRTRIENHLENKEAVTNKVTRAVTNEWAELESFLSNYEFDGRTLYSRLKQDDSPVIIDNILEQVYQSPELFTIGQMEQSVDLLVDGLRIDALKEFD